jgi:hypothetical protein
MTFDNEINKKGIFIEKKIVIKDIEFAAVLMKIWLRLITYKIMMYFAN